MAPLFIFPTMRFRLLLCLVFASLVGPGNDAGAQDAKRTSNNVDFEKQVRPLLLKHCGDCHGPETQESSLRLDAKHFAFKGGDGGRVLVPGESAKSELIQRIVSKDDDLRMPPENPLPENEIDLLRRWVDSGAKWPESDYDKQARVDRRLQHWAFQTVKKVVPPQDPSFPNPIDRFVARKLKQQGLWFSPQADRRTLIRRLSLDLTGLPPTPEEVNDYATDLSKDAYEKIVRRLLESPRYGERWGQHWLDVVRYADTHGFEVNTPRENAWPYRDYVIRAFNEDMPYDQFIREQIAGDAYQADAATGFLVASAVLLPGQIGQDDASKRLARQDELDEMVVGTGATFLGISIGCARCHDHKFDPITAEDYYAMQAFFAGVDFGDREIKDKDYHLRMKQAELLAPKIRQLKQEIESWEPPVFSGTTILIDEADKKRTRYLIKENGPGANPEGKARGYRSDEGAIDRSPNLSGGSYTWWNNQPGQDVMVYAPGVDGRYRLWISWGVHGSGVHTRDARYILDKDGNLDTRDDQTELATVDQYYPAYVSTGNSEMKPLWSGFLDVGSVLLNEKSVILIRGGKTGTGITADVIALQSELQDNEAKPKRAPPRLREPVDFAKNVDRFQPVPARYVRFEVFATDKNNFREPCIDELEIFTSGKDAKNIALKSNGSAVTSSGNYGDGTGIHQLAHLNDGKYGNSRSWISNEQGKGWVQVEFSKEFLIERVVWGRDRLGKFKDRLPIEYRIQVSTDQKNWQTVASHEDRMPFGVSSNATLTAQRLAGDAASSRLKEIGKNLKELEQRHSELQKNRRVYAGVFRSPDKSFVLRRGNPELKGAPVVPHVPRLFPEQLQMEDTAPENNRRLQLANWIASRKNPLTARVMVNRIWSYHFGQGLVSTPSDLGVNAAPPTHPEMLDWLAYEFMEKGWSVKWLHKLIVSSETYRQQSRVDPVATKVDADNRLYWRFQTRRLEAEAIRDSMLSVTGELNFKTGGPGFNFFETRGGLSGFPEKTEFGPEEFRRMVYAHKIRMERVPVFGAFDCPDAGQATPERSRSTTAIQALNLFNSPFVLDRSRQFANRVRKETSSKENEDWVVRAFQLGFGRNPSNTESTASIKVVEQHGLEALCRVILNSNEFLFLP